MEEVDGGELVDAGLVRVWFSVTGFMLQKTRMKDVYVVKAAGISYQLLVKVKLKVDAGRKKVEECERKVIGKKKNEL